MNLDLFKFNSDQYVVAKGITEAVDAYLNNFPNANKLSVLATIRTIEKIWTLHPVIIEKEAK